MTDASSSIHSQAFGGRPLRAIAIAVGLLAVVVVALWLWRGVRGGGGGYQPRGALDVVTAPVVVGPAPVALSALGEVRALRQVTLAAEVAGRVAAISFEPGQRVAAGAVLVRLDDSTEQADLAAARASAAFAEQQLARATDLAASGAVATELLQQRQSERDAAAAQVKQLEARIVKLRIRAPFAGELGLRRVDLGQYLNAGDAAVTLTDLATVYVNFDVPQQELPNLAVGQSVQVRSDAPGAPSLGGRISAIEPQVSPDTRTATVQATFANAARALRPGMYVTTVVELPAEQGAVLVPATAIMTSASGDAAAVVRGLSPEKVGKAEIVPVVTGRRVGDRVVVTRGLAAGDVLVTEGQVRLQPGATVRVVDEAGATATPAGSVQAPER